MKREQVDPAFLDVPGFPHDPYARRPYHRLTTVRSTSLVAPVSKLKEPMYLGRLTPYYSIGTVALPTRVRARSIETVSCHGKRSQELQSNLNKFSINIFQVPSGRILYGVTLDVVVSSHNLVALLEDCYYESIKLTLSDGRGLTLHDLIDEEIKKLYPAIEWEPEPDLHQILFLSPVLTGVGAGMY